MISILNNNNNQKQQLEQMHFSNNSAFLCQLGGPYQANSENPESNIFELEPLQIQQEQQNLSTNNESLLDQEYQELDNFLQRFESQSQEYSNNNINQDKEKRPIEQQQQMEFSSEQQQQQLQDENLFEIPDFNSSSNDFSNSDLNFNKNNDNIIISIQQEKQQQQLIEDFSTYSLSFSKSNSSIIENEQFNFNENNIQSQQQQLQQELKDEEKELSDYKKQLRLKRNYIWFIYYNHQAALKNDKKFQNCHGSAQILQKINEIIKNNKISSHEGLKKTCKNLISQNQQHLAEALIHSIFYWVSQKQDINNNKQTFLEQKIENSKRLSVQNRKYYLDLVPKFLEELQEIYDQVIRG